MPGGRKPREGLDERQIRAAELVAAGALNLDIARQLEIGTRTLIGWKRDPAFRTAVLDASRELFAYAVPVAVRTLREVMEDKGAAAAARVKAAELVLRGASVAVTQGPIDGAPPDPDVQVSGVVMVPAKRPVQRPDAALIQEIVVAARTVSMDVD